MNSNIKTAFSLINLAKSNDLDMRNPKHQFILEHLLTGHSPPVKNDPFVADFPNADLCATHERYEAYLVHQGKGKSLCLGVKLPGDKIRYYGCVKKGTPLEREMKRLSANADSWRELATAPRVKGYRSPLPVLNVSCKVRRQSKSSGIRISHILTDADTFQTLPENLSVLKEIPAIIPPIWATNSTRALNQGRKAEELYNSLHPQSTWLNEKADARQPWDFISPAGVKIDIKSTHNASGHLILEDTKINASRVQPDVFTLIFLPTEGKGQEIGSISLNEIKEKITNGAITSYLDQRNPAKPVICWKIAQCHLQHQSEYEKVKKLSILK